MRWNAVTALAAATLSVSLMAWVSVILAESLRAFPLPEGY